jgi:hypothetical protein
LRFPARRGYDPTGFEQDTEKPEKRGVGFQSGAKSGARNFELQEIVESWRRLSTADRSAVLAKVRAILAKGGREGGL